MKLWHYTKMGLQQGPVPEDELRQKIRRGEIGGANLVWHEGMADWLPLSQVPELQPAPVTDTQVPATLPAGQVPPSLPLAPAERGQIPLPQPPAYDGDYAPPRIPNYLWQSIVALVASGLMMLVMCLPVGMPFAIVALVYASKVEGLRVQGNLPAAKDASRSAKIWMIISYSISALPVLGLIVVFLISAFSAIN